MTNVCVLGETHLAQTHRKALEELGRPTVNVAGADIVFIGHDVLDHTGKDVAKVHSWIRYAHQMTMTKVPIVVLSQVPPGFMREAKKRLASDARQLIYQVDTIIVKTAVERVKVPEQIIVGLAGPIGFAYAPPAYRAYIDLFNNQYCRTPVVWTDYESAEFAKMAINYYLAVQVQTSTYLARRAAKLGATWEDVTKALRGDARIGPAAYLTPGKINQHLKRDVETIDGYSDKPAPVVAQDQTEPVSEG